MSGASKNTIQLSEPLERLLFAILSRLENMHRHKISYKWIAMNIIQEFLQPHSIKFGIWSISKRAWNSPGEDPLILDDAAKTGRHIFETYDSLILLAKSEEDIEDALTSFNRGFLPMYEILES